MAGQDNLRGVLIRLDGKYPSLFQVLLEKSPIIILIHAFQHDALEIPLRLQDTQFRGEPLHMPDAREGGKFLHQRIAHRDRTGLIRGITIKIRYLDMRPETYHLLAHLLLKTHHDRHGKNHDRQSQGDSRQGDTDDGRGSPALPLLAKVNLSRYE